MPIQSFACDHTEQLWLHNVAPHKLGWSSISRKVFVKLTAIDLASQVNELLVPPGNRLEKLIGDREGFWSIRINDQWRIVFRWQNGDAYEVEVVDYH